MVDGNGMIGMLGMYQVASIRYPVSVSVSVSGLISSSGDGEKSEVILSYYRYGYYVDYPSPCDYPFPFPFPISPFPFPFASTFPYSLSLVQFGPDCYDTTLSWSCLPTDIYRSTGTIEQKATIYRLGMNC